MTLYLVELHEDDFDYDIFETAIVWAENPEEAEQKVRKAVRYEDEELFPGHKRQLWIEDPNWRLVVTPAPTSGIVYAHMHPG